MNIAVLEIRNYLLKPNVLEHFIDYFEEHFITSQEAENMSILGQFQRIGEPDHFVWLRGFSDMQTRLKGLQNFYGGGIWKKHRLVANDMMLESDNVHLLRPLSNIADLTCGLDAYAVAADLAAGTISYNTGVIAVDFYKALPGKRDALIDRFQTQIVPVYQNRGIQVRGLFVAEMAENEFTGLPVIQNEDEFVVITAYESEEAYQQKRGEMSILINEATGTLLDATPETLLLSPALRSPLRYLHQQQHKRP